MKARGKVEVKDGRLLQDAVPHPWDNKFWPRLILQAEAAVVAVRGVPCVLPWI